MRIWLKTNHGVSEVSQEDVRRLHEQGKLTDRMRVLSRDGAHWITYAELQSQGSLDGGGDSARRFVFGAVAVVVLGAVVAGGLLLIPWGPDERERAEAARGRAVEARQAAVATQAESLSPDAWRKAKAKETEGEEAFVAEQFLHARSRWNVARSLFDEARSQAMANREARQLALDEKEVADEVRSQALAKKVPDQAGETWQQAEAMAAKAQTALDEGHPRASRQHWQEAATLYTQALAAVSVRQDAEDARLIAGGARLDAKNAGAPDKVAPLWEKACQRFEAAETAYQGGRYEAATQAWRDATHDYHRAEQAMETVPKLDDARSMAAMARQWCVEAGARKKAPAAWREAEAHMQVARAAMEEGRYDDAKRAFEKARLQYGGALSDIRTRKKAVQMEAEVAAARGKAALAGGREAAPELWKLARGKAAVAKSAVAKGEYPRAVGLWKAAIELYDQTRTAVELRKEVAKLRADVTTARKQAEEAGAAESQPEAWAEAEASSVAAGKAFAAGELKEARKRWKDALAAYREAAAADATAVSGKVWKVVSFHRSSIAPTQEGAVLSSAKRYLWVELAPLDDRKLVAGELHKAAKLTKDGKHLECVAAIVKDGHVTLIFNAWLSGKGEHVLDLQGDTVILNVTTKGD